MSILGRILPFFLSFYASAESAENSLLKGDRLHNCSTALLETEQKVNITPLFAPDFAPTNFVR